jgi:hypothetical protein
MSLTNMFTLLIAVMSVVGSAVANAQVPDKTISTEPRSRCVGGRPLPHCANYLVIDFAVLGALTANEYGSRDNRVSADFGLMQNRGLGSAVGGSLGIHAGSLVGLSLKARFRRWLTPQVGLDFAAGVLLGEWEYEGDRQTDPGFTSQMDLSYRDWIGLTTRFEYASRAPDTPPDPNKQLHVGVRVGGKPAMITIVAVPLIGWLLWSISGGE